MTSGITGADAWHLSDRLSLQQAILEARREGFPYLVQRRITVSRDGRIVRVSRKSYLRISGVPMRQPLTHPWHAECLRCACRAQFINRRDAECWRDIHEFENFSDGHLVRILLETDKSMIDMAEVCEVELLPKRPKF